MTELGPIRLTFHGCSTPPASRKKQGFPLRSQSWNTITIIVGKYLWQLGLSQLDHIFSYNTNHTQKWRAQVQKGKLQNKDLVSTNQLSIKMSQSHRTSLVGVGFLLSVPEVSTSALDSFAIECTRHFPHNAKLSYTAQVFRLPSKSRQCWLASH